MLLSLTTAMLEAARLGRYMGKETGETALLRELLDALPAGDILLADRYYCSYFMIALLLQRRVDFVVRLHQMRTTDFRRGRRLGKGDHIVRWLRPTKPDWMDQATYNRMPESIELREVEATIELPGFRSDSLVVVTTLTDAAQYSRKDLADLYRRRWQAELDIRTIKITMGMDVLRCQTPRTPRGPRSSPPQWSGRRNSASRCSNREPRGRSPVKRCSVSVGSASLVFFSKKTAPRVHLWRHVERRVRLTQRRLRQTRLRRHHVQPLDGERTRTQRRDLVSEAG